MTTTQKVAGDKLVDALAGLVENPISPDVVVALAAYERTAAEADVDPTAIAAVRDAVTHARKTFARDLNAYGHSHTQQYGVTGIGRVRQAIAYAIPFARRDDLRQAEQDLAAAERAAADARAEMAGAVADRDVDAVRRLSATVQVDHPHKVAEAHTLVLGLQLEEMNWRLQAATEEQASAKAAANQAQQRIQEVRAQLQQAQEAAHLATREQIYQDGMVTDLRTRTGALSSQLDSVRLAHEEQMDAQLRRLAGMPELTGTPEPAQRSDRMVVLSAGYTGPGGGQ